MKKYRLTSMCFIIVMILFDLALICLAIVLTISPDVTPLYAIIFAWTMVLLFLFSWFTGFKHKIILNFKKRKIIIGGYVGLVKNISINIDDVLSIEAIKNPVAPKQFATIQVRLKNGKQYETLGCSSFLCNKDAHKTEMIVAQLNEEIAKLQLK